MAANHVVDVRILVEEFLVVVDLVWVVVVGLKILLLRVLLVLVVLLNLLLVLVVLLILRILRILLILLILSILLTRTRIRASSTIKIVPYLNQSVVRMNL